MFGQAKNKVSQSKSTKEKEIADPNSDDDEDPPELERIKEKSAKTHAGKSTQRLGKKDVEVSLL
jgi:hypothetical protein